MGVYFALGSTCLEVSHQYVFENELYISFKWRNKLLINLTGHRKSACCLQLLVFLEIWVIAPFWHWRTQVFPKGCCYDDKSTQTRCKVCSNLTKCTTTIDFRLTSVFFINLEHLSQPILVFYSYFEKVNVGWRCAVNFLSK